MKQERLPPLWALELNRLTVETQVASLEIGGAEGNGSRPANSGRVDRSWAVDRARMWVMDGGSPKTPKRERKATETERRNAMSKALLREALGLDYFWIDRWEEDGEVKEKSLAPESLPQFILDNFAEAAKKNADPRTPRGIKARFDEYIKDVESYIDRLVAAGCNRRVICFCLEELSPYSEATRRGHRRASRLGPDDEYEQLDEYEKKPEHTTRKHTEFIKREATGLRHLIYVQRRALQLAAHVQKRALPSGLFTTLEDPDDALALLMSLLGWLSELAEDYAAPMKTTLLKGKELLHLTAYVKLVAHMNNIVGRDRARMDRTLADLLNLVVDTMPEPRFKVKQSPRKTKGKRPAPETKAKRPAPTRAPSDLLGKLHDFERAQEWLYKELMGSLEKLHRFHEEH